ncbi:MAG: hypothetical protein GWO07_04660 [Candidatus Dadabacteria bacterium]|nr:hypothetical protein [Candidatus Dadabacteria bacterium]NIS08052.1 hypothetical protein [Candidatus Dadabacteria bacterium]NIY22492.1 hypothetical protein [Candidatus Dadabacteria bacterium]
MKKYEYEILFHRKVKGNVTWYFASKPNKKVGTSLIKILNKLGAKGWEASGTGNLTGESIAEVLLRREKGKK